MNTLHIFNVTADGQVFIWGLSVSRYEKLIWFIRFLCINDKIKMNELKRYSLPLFKIILLFTIPGNNNKSYLLLLVVFFPTQRCFEEQEQQRCIQNQRQMMNLKTCELFSFVYSSFSNELPKLKYNSVYSKTDSADRLTELKTYSWVTTGVSNCSLTTERFSADNVVIQFFIVWKSPQY